MFLTNFTKEFSRKQNETCINEEGYYTKQPISIKMVKIVFMSIILLISLVGNTLIIVVVYKRKELRKTVNFFIVNMAVSDMIFPLMKIPVLLVNEATDSFRWQVRGATGLILCILLFLLWNISTTVSVQSLLWIAVDRFVAVVFPMKIKMISSRFRAVVIASTWIVAVVINLKDFYVVKVEKEVCVEDTEASMIYKVSSYIIIAGVWAAPLIVMTILYCAIGVTLLRRHKMVVRVNMIFMNQKNKRNYRAIKMSVCIMAAFYCCFVSHVAYLILKVSGKWESLVTDTTFCSFPDLIWFLSYLGLFLSSITNPIICLMFVERYRRAIKDICFCLKSRESNRNDVENGKLAQITLQTIRVIPENKSNLAYSESRETKHSTSL
ncbi:QRFP-like peptide receptor [Montipora foliosa]|uniref:QRFP-like peptide receptor n=1 Tax=Montipora foliosa TaxID=591990 RepID=UPI0035F21916